MWNVQWNPAELWLIKTRKFFHMRTRKQTVKGKCVMNQRQPKFTGTWRLLGMTKPLNSAAVTDVAFQSTHRKGCQSELLVVHSKGGRCNFWGVLYCDDWRSPWWVSRDGPQHDRGRSDKSWLVWILTIMPVRLYFKTLLFCSVLFLNTKFYILCEC